jgi:UDP:flavonoid glycosyltransferase YjiC (YdhE family)
VWLVYALGSGWGHLTRAVALARIAGRARAVRILTNSPYADIVRAALPELDLRVVESGAAVMREIGECRPACLIVDTFPRGIVGELAGLLPEFGGGKVLVHRDLNPRYVASRQLREFVGAHYDLVIVPGAGEGSQFGYLPAACGTAPWLVRACNEIPAPLGDPYVLVCAGGNPAELAWYGAVTSRIQGRAPVRCVAAERPPGCPEGCWVRYWPAMDLIAGASAVVGGAGYNTVQECLALRAPLIARAWERKYDRQALRAERTGVRLVREPEEAAEAAVEAMRAWPWPRPLFHNGAAEAVERIGFELSAISYQPSAKPSR